MMKKFSVSSFDNFRYHCDVVNVTRESENSCLCLGQNDSFFRHLAIILSDSRILYLASIYTQLALDRQLQLIGNNNYSASNRVPIYSAYVIDC